MVQKRSNRLIVRLIVSLSLSRSLESSKDRNLWMDGNGSKHSLVYPDSRYLERGKTSQSRFPNTSRLRNCSFPRDTRAITRLPFGFPTVSFTEKILCEKEKLCLSLSFSLSFSSLPTFVSRSWRSLIITRQFHEEKRKRRKERKKERKSRIAIQRIKHIYIYIYILFLSRRNFADCLFIRLCSESSFVS